MSVTPFSFFELPPELRSDIYARLTQSTRPVKLADPADKDIWIVAVEPYIPPHLLRVSKQFKSEYEREIFGCMKLRLRTEMAKPFAQRLPFCSLDHSYLFGSIRHIELTVDIRTHALRDDFLSEEFILPLLCLAPQLRTLNLRLELLLDELMGHELDSLDGLYSTGIRTVDVFTRIEYLRNLVAHLRPPVKVDVGMFIRVILAEIQRRCSWGSLTRNILSDDLKDDLDEDLDRLENQWAVFRASPSNGPYALCGMALEVDKCGRFRVEEYDAAVRKAFTAHCLLEVGSDFFDSESELDL